MAVFTSYDLVGAKEDVSDVISNISPTKTPFQSGIGSEKVTQKLFQWQEDELRAAAQNAKVEGADASEVAITATSLVTNRTQILSETILIADGLDTTDKYGRAKETAYQMAKTAAQLKRDLELSFVGIHQAAVAGDSSTARKMASYTSLVHTDHHNFLGAATNLTEDDVVTMQQELFDEGADPSVLMVTPSNAVIVADFANKVTNVQNVAATENVAAVTVRGRDMGNATTLVNNVDIYKSPFGSLRVIINRFVRAKDSLVYDPDMWKKMVFRPWTRTTLAKTGDSTKIQMLGEFSLKHRNQHASGVIRDNDTDINP